MGYVVLAVRFQPDIVDQEYFEMTSLTNPERLRNAEAKFITVLFPVIASLSCPWNHAHTRIDILPRPSRRLFAHGRARFHFGQSFRR